MIQKKYRRVTGISRSKMSPLKFSIIIPSYNQGQFIERTILSILNQSFLNFELIIIDGGSNDNTTEILRKYDSKISYWVSEKDEGQSDAFNKGFERATGDVIGWINSDDIYYPDAFSKAAAFFEMDAETDALFGNYDFIDENDSIIHSKKEIVFDPETAYWTKKCNHANVAGFFKKTCFLKSGLLNPNLHFAMDYDLYLRFGLDGLNFRQMKTPFGAYRIHTTSKSASLNPKMLAEVEKVHKMFEKQFGNEKLEPIYKRYYYAKRIVYKLFSGCYTLSNIRSIKNLASRID
jgi:glycosyltransferase involved in cell wall biosynthesis